MRVTKARAPRTSPQWPMRSSTVVGTNALTADEVMLACAVNVCRLRLASELTASTRNSIAYAVPSRPRMYGRSASRRPYSTRSAAKPCARLSAWSAAPSESAMQEVRVSCRALRTMAIPSPTPPTSAVAGTRAPWKAMPLMSAPRMPWVRIFVRMFNDPSPNALLSIINRLNPRGPPAGSVRASVHTMSARVALLISVLVPSRRKPSSTGVAVNSPLSRSLPCPGSVSPHETTVPAATAAATSCACSGRPPTQTDTAPRNVFAWATARVRSRRAIARTSSHIVSSWLNPPPCDAGTYCAGRPYSSSSAAIRSGNSSLSSSSAMCLYENGFVSSLGSPRSWSMGLAPTSTPGAGMSRHPGQPGTGPVRVGEEGFQRRRQQQVLGREATLEEHLARQTTLDLATRRARDGTGPDQHDTCGHAVLTTDEIPDRRRGVVQRPFVAAAGHGLLHDHHLLPAAIDAEDRTGAFGQRRMGGSRVDLDVVWVEVAARDHEHLLDTSGNVELTVAQDAEITGPQEARLAICGRCVVRLRGLLRSLPIAPRDAGTLYPDLADPVRPEHRTAVRIDDPHLEAVRDLTTADQLTRLCRGGRGRDDRVPLEHRRVDRQHHRLGQAAVPADHQRRLGHSVPRGDGLWTQPEHGEAVPEGAQRPSVDRLGATDRIPPRGQIAPGHLLVGDPAGTQVVGEVGCGRQRHPVPVQQVQPGMWSPEERRRRHERGPATEEHR